MSQFGKKDVECEADQNQTADLTRDRKPDRIKPSFSGTVHVPTAIM